MFVRNIFLRLLTAISPRLNVEARYFWAFRKRINLKRPQSFAEKLAFLSLYRYANDPLVIQCADKYRVREYVKEVGCEDALNELLAVYDKPEEINWESLPDAFVLKWNFGAGKNVVCPEKANLNERETKDALKSMGRKQEYLKSAELQYAKIPKKIICEKFLSDHTGTLPRDYKAYCFNGKVKCLLIMTGRNEKMSACFMSPQWKLIGGTHKYEVGKLPEKPASLEKMVEYSERLAAPFPFVRVDWYDINGRLVFGELTFTPAGMTGCSQTDIDGKSMGELLEL